MKYVRRSLSMKRIFAAFLALAMVFSLLAACGKKDGAVDKSVDTPNQPTDTQSQTGDVTSNSPKPIAEVRPYSVDELRKMEVHPSDDATLTYAYASPFYSVTQMGHQSDASCFGGLFFETLVSWDTINNQIAPNHAKSWEWTGDTVLRLHLEEGVTSIMGDPFTASDVLYSFEYQFNCGLLKAYYGVIDFENSRVVDDYTIDIALKNPYPFFVLDMCAAYFTVMVKASAEKIGDQSALDWDPGCGTGPYKLVETNKSTFIKAERRDDYWSALPYYKYMVFNAVTDATTRVFGLEAGDFMATNNVSYAQADAALTNDNITVWADALPGGCYNFYMNSALEVFQKKEVRQAIALAINYETIASIVFADMASVSDSVIAPLASDHYIAPDDASKNCIRFDLDEAKRLMISAGYANGFEIKLTYRGIDVSSIKICEMLQNMLAQINITVTLEPVEGAVYSTIVKGGTYETAVGVGANPNPKTNIQQIDPRVPYSSVPCSAGQYWYDGNMEELYSMLDACLFTVDEGARLEAWDKMHALSREYCPKIMLVYQYSIFLTNSDIISSGRDSYGNANYCWLYEADYITG